MPVLICHRRPVQRKRREAMPPHVDPLVRVRGPNCRDECRACALFAEKRPGQGFQREPCLRPLPCMKRESQQHGSGCCLWMVQSGMAAAAAELATVARVGTAAAELATVARFGTAEAAAELATAMDTDVMPRSAAEVDAMAERHSAELFRRIRWCVDQGPDYWPANKFVHLAPGDDAAFTLGIAPVRVLSRACSRSLAPSRMYTQTNQANGSGTRTAVRTPRAFPMLTRQCAAYCPAAARSSRTPRTAGSVRSVRNGLICNFASGMVTTSLSGGGIVPPAARRPGWARPPAPSQKSRWPTRSWPHAVRK